jgi:ATP-dependent Clp protease ATP-binding subunit ClpC
MFERFTERARRVVFFARYEASNLGSLQIDTEHLLLGLVRESNGVSARVLGAAGVSMHSIRPAVEQRTPFQEKVSTSVEIPFTAAAKATLERAAVEADRFQHSYIGCEHLLLALLHAPESTAGQVLAASGLSYDVARKQVVQLLDERAGAVSPPPATRADLVAAIEHIKRDVSQLAALIDHGAQAGDDVPGPSELADRIHRSLDALKSLRDL